MSELAHDYGFSREQIENAIRHSVLFAIMSSLGKRNKGKRKAMTPAEREQRRRAGIASAKARNFFVIPKARKAKGARRTRRKASGDNCHLAPRRNLPRRGNSEQQD